MATKASSPPPKPAPRPATKPAATTPTRSTGTPSPRPTASRPAGSGGSTGSSAQARTAGNSANGNSTGSSSSKASESVSPNQKNQKVSENPFVNAIHDDGVKPQEQDSLHLSEEAKNGSQPKDDKRSQELADNLLASWEMDDKQQAKDAKATEPRESNAQPEKPKLPAAQDLLGTESEEARKQVMEQAMEGNPEAIALLGDSLNQYQEMMRENRSSELHNSGDWVIDSLSAVQQQGYQQNQEWLSADNYKSLERELDRPEVKEMFQGAVSRGNEDVLKSLRTQADSKDKGKDQQVRPSQAGELLSYAGEHLQPGDYQRMLNSNVDLGRSNTTKVFRQALESKNPDARKALQQMLGSEDPARAANMLGQMTEHIGAPEMSKLKELAHANSFNSASAAETLQRAAGAGRPGAEEAIQGLKEDKAASRLGLMDRLGEQAADGNLDARRQYQEMLRSEDYGTQSAARSHMNESFNSGDLWALDVSRGVDSVKYDRKNMAESLHQQYEREQDPALAAHVLDTAGNAPLAEKALQQVGDRAAGGDERAIESLARFITDNPRPIMDLNAFEGREEVAQKVLSRLSQVSEDGHSQTVTDKLLAVHAEGVEAASHDKYNDFQPKTDIYRALGDAASHLPAGHESSQQARELLLDQLASRQRDGQGQLEKRAAAALEGLSHLTGTLDLGQTSQLQQFALQRDHDLGVKATSVMKESMQKFSPEEQQKMSSEMLKELRDPHFQSDFQKLELLKEHLSNDDIKALAKRTGWHDQERNDFLTGVLGQDGVPQAAQESIIKEIAANGGAGLTPEQRTRMVDFVANGHNNELKDLVVDKVLPNAPDLREELSDLSSQFSRDLFRESQKVLESGDKSDPMYRLGQLMRAQQLGLTGEFQDQVDQGKVAAQIDDLVRSNPALQKAIGEVRDSSLEQWKQYGGGYEAVQKQSDYLKSPEFQQKLRLMDPAQRDELLSQEMAKMAMLAPDRVEGLMEGLSENQVERAKETPLEGLGRLSLEQREQVIDKVLQGTFEGDSHFSDLFGDSKTGLKAYKDLVSEIANQPPSAGKDKLMALLKRAGLHNNDGRLSAALGAMGVVGLSDQIFRGEMPEDFKEFVQTGAAINGVAGSLYPSYKLGASIASNFTELSRPGAKTLQVLKHARAVTGKAPVVGDVLGTVLDGMSAGEAFMNGDKAKGSAYLGATLLGGVATGAGIYGLAAGVAFGPPGWIALGAGLAATGVSYAASNMDGKDEALLKELNAFKPAAAAFHAMDGSGTADGQLIRALQGHSEQEMADIRAEYQHLFKRDLVNDIQWDTSGHYESFLTRLAQGYPENINNDSRQDAANLHEAMNGWGTTNTTLTSILAGRSPEQLREIARVFEKDHGSLIDWIKADTSGQFERAILSQLRHAGVQ